MSIFDYLEDKDKAIFSVGVRNSETITDNDYKVNIQAIEDLKPIYINACFTIQVLLRRLEELDDYENVIRTVNEGNEALHSTLKNEVQYFDKNTGKRKGTN